jgi:hypothetical protein
MSLVRSSKTLVMLLACAAALAALARSATAAAPGECPEILPTSSVTAGMTGEGWTVSTGTVPETFDVTVLGVLKNGVGPGRDMIVVDTSSPAVDAAGGIWFGMSGSPVYIGGKLAGVLAFGLSEGPSSIAGLTPASDVVTVANYPAAAARALSSSVRLPRSLARTVARRANRLPADVSTLARLKMPVSVSGVNARGLKRVQKLLTRRHVAAVVHAGASADAGDSAPLDEVVPGGNFAAALSYGDVTMGGVGTTSYVCDGKAVAFGHPLFQTGKTHMGANVADALTVVDDPIGGPFKLANITGSIGLLDQDRTAGIRARLGTDVPTVPVVTSLRSLDTGLARLGETDVAFLDALPDLAFTHLFSNVDSVLDAVGPGSAKYTWTVRGNRKDGTPWKLQRGNVYVSDFDIAFDSGSELASELAEIAAFRREKVTISDISLSGTVTQDVHRLDLVRLEVKRHGRFVKVRDTLAASPRETLQFRAVLEPSDGGDLRLVPFSLRMPHSIANGAFIQVSGGTSGEGEGEFEDCIEGSDCDNGPTTFPALLKSFTAQPRNNVLAAKILGADASRVKAGKRIWLDEFVNGQKLVVVTPRGRGLG